MVIPHTGVLNLKELRIAVDPGSRLEKLDCSQNLD